MKILFIYQALSTFVKKDLEILKSAHTVREVHFKNASSILSLWEGIKWCDITFSWFGKLHAFFSIIISKVLNKRSIVIAGGDDATKYIVGGKKYGLFAHPLKKRFAYYTFKHSDLIITISRFTQNELIAYAKIELKKIKLVYHGFDSDVFKMLPNVKKGNLVVTIGDISWENFYRKSHKLIVETASFLPEFQFVFVGPSIDDSILELKRFASPNVVFEGELNEGALIEILRKSAVYIQASEWESFGCALAEAMLCECAPVVSRNTALPEVVGSCAHYIDHLNCAELAEKIKLAIADKKIGKSARERVVKMFPLAKRKEELLNAISGLDTQSHG